MVKLSEDMIVARTRVSDLNQVKKLNCWGAELSDISVIRKLRNVEVLSLSVNSISTLSDIQNCTNLQELYIRKNCIPDISEICYLRDLPRLKNLWLEENPCAEGDANLYRWTVLKNVPQLQKLDNVGVTSEEMAEAMRRGLELDHPLDGGAPNQSSQLCRRQQQEVSAGSGQNPRGGRSQSDTEQAYCQQRKESVLSPSRRVSNAVWPEERQPLSQSQAYSASTMSYQAQYEESPSASLERQSTGGGSGQLYMAREQTPEEGVRRAGVREEQGPPQRGQQRNSYIGPPSDYHRQERECHQPVQHYHQTSSRGTTPSEEGQAGLATARSRSDLTVVREGLLLPTSQGRLTRENSSLARGASSSNAPAQEVCSPSYDQHQHSIVEQHYEATYRNVDQQLEGAAQLVANRAISPQRPYPLRPKNRNSNVLSAILCLIKEIDGPSLEVVEMAVRCRMEELED